MKCKTTPQHRITHYSTFNCEFKYLNGKKGIKDRKKQMETFVYKENNFSFRVKHLIECLRCLMLFFHFLSTFFGYTAKKIIIPFVRFLCKWWWLLPNMINLPFSGLWLLLPLCLFDIDRVLSHAAHKFLKISFFFSRIVRLFCNKNCCINWYEFFALPFPQRFYILSLNNEIWHLIDRIRCIDT